jgi:hypothetical protein
MAKVIRLTESDVSNIVYNVLNEAHVIDQQFGQSKSPGSFEAALVNAWKMASDSNKEKLENAFPEYFPREAMYGNDEEPFDFREFPYRGAYDDYYKGWQGRHPSR